ncbi:hypothetical protein VNO80_19077 [Phaseolus coccineus]|uniref:VQ domain-containing protein n=1 Tax=Phaseolus coccineus TaxID=3886 RepID=A0AAN9MFH1_PHACN
MNPPEIPAAGAPPPKKEVQLQGPRPPPLKVRNESRKIKKPPPHPAAQHHGPPEQKQSQRKPVVIYSVSPRVIHVKPGDFMDLVQRLTGAPPGEDPPARCGDVSPAERLASIEKTSPSEREKVMHSGNDELMSMLDEGVEVGQFPGILSPEPGTLPPIPAMFSPAREALTASYWNEFSPSYWSPASSFLASPSGFLPMGVASPQPSPNLFSLFES